MKEKIFSKILDKSHQYNFYKDNYYKFKTKNENLKKRNEKLADRNNRLKDKNNSIKDKNNRLKDKTNRLKETNKRIKNKNKELVKKLAFINFDEFLCNSYLMPVVKVPFSYEDKQCFAFMDYLSKYLTDIALNSEQPLISIIMPTYNRKDRILVAIDSVLNQSYSNFELIIVDDASDDGTLDVLNSINDNRLKIISHTENKGVSAARNTALKAVNGKYIAYLDSDNEWNINYLSSMVGAFLELPDADALYSGQILYHEFDSDPFAIRFGAYNKSLLNNRNYIDLNCFCHKSDVYEKIGGFDESLLKLVDWDLILRISNDFTIYSIPILLSNYYHHSDESRVSFIYDHTDVTYNDCVSEIIAKNSRNYPIEPSLDKKVSVIIPNYESLDELRKCVDSILSFNQEMVDIIIIDNDSNNEVVEYLKSLDADNKAKIILNDVKHSFTQCIEQGIEASDENSDILLLNNNTILTDGAITNLQKFAYNYEECAIAVPQKMLYGNDPEIKKHMPFANKSFECNVTPSRIHHNIKNIPVFQDDSLLELNFAPFFCIYIKREVYNDTLGFDLELGGYGSDRIFSDYITHFLNMKIYQCPTSFVYQKLNADSDDFEVKNFELEFNKNCLDLNESEYSKRLWDL